MSKRSNAVKNIVEAAQVIESTVQVLNNEVQTETKVETPFDGAAFIKEQGGVSKAIRALTEQGKTRAEVAKMLDKRYQHVRNVLITPIKKVAEPKTETTTDESVTESTD